MLWPHPLSLSRTPVPWYRHPPLRVGLPPSVRSFWKQLHRLAQRCVPTVTLNPFKWRILTITSVKQLISLPGRSWLATQVSSLTLSFLKKPHLQRQTLRNNRSCHGLCFPYPDPPAGPQGLALPVISHFHPMTLTSSISLHPPCWCYPGVLSPATNALLLKDL